MQVIKNRKKTFIYDMIKILLIVCIIRMFCIAIIQVNGTSMLPTLRDQERLIMNKLAYILCTPQRGDVIIFQQPNHSSNQMIKRVIAIAGDTIEIKDGRVFVNHKLLKESYVKMSSFQQFYKRVVPEDSVFVLGDNRNYSKDSRYKDVGFISLNLIEGKGSFVVWPIKNFRKIQ